MEREIEIQGTPTGEGFTVELKARGKALTKAETDHLLNVVSDYFAHVGFTTLTISGFRRPDSQVDRDFFKFQVVEQGEKWEDRSPLPPAKPSKAAAKKKAPAKKKSR